MDTGSDKAVLGTHRALRFQQLYAIVRRPNSHKLCYPKRGRKTVRDKRENRRSLHRLRPGRFSNSRDGISGG
jgi:hypothetical protein